MQARTVADGSPVGEFLVDPGLSGQSYKLSNCTPPEVRHSKLLNFDVSECFYSLQSLINLLLY